MCQYDSDSVRIRLQQNEIDGGTAVWSDRGSGDYVEVREEQETGICQVWLSVALGISMCGESAYYGRANAKGLIILTYRLMKVCAQTVCF